MTTLSKQLYQTIFLPSYSIQLFNTSSDIKENDLEMLKTIVEYGRLCVDGNVNKPFQSLYFLIKDWVFPYHYTYGSTGGDVLLDKRLQVIIDGL